MDAPRDGILLQMPSYSLDTTQQASAALYLRQQFYLVSEIGIRRILNRGKETRKGNPLALEFICSPTRWIKLLRRNNGPGAGRATEMVVGDSST
jgi:hypothetical protein